jgi:hypothetical protein
MAALDLTSRACLPLGIESSLLEGGGGSKTFSVLFLIYRNACVRYFERERVAGYIRKMLDIGLSGSLEVW